MERTFPCGASGPGGLQAGYLKTASLNRILRGRFYADRRENAGNRRAERLRPGCTQTAREDALRPPFPWESVTFLHPGSGQM